MLKHDECAAAISSSGLVRPFGSSARDAQETSYDPRCEESRDTVPDPLVSEPLHCALAVRVVAMECSFDSAAVNFFHRLVPSKRLELTAAASADSATAGLEEWVCAAV
jgi:hypothetical protein